ncbi:hypothetical protein, partial [Roseisolibacter sp. H3M3-2]|uniref:hypothetical protein n=1 Tax=Roseisolibacter sp. H3M3-2 TaxID=3031323 RepID=UPI0023DBF54E
RAQQPVPPRPVPADTARRPAPADTVRAPAPVERAARARGDSIRGIPDSLATRPVRRDSIKAPIARGELPTVVEVGRPYRWTRDSLFNTGSLTALDLLERVPGLTGFRTGWLASYQAAAHLGDFRRVRVFRDGVELDPLDPRGGGVLELQEAQLWQLDEVLIERPAGEVRVHLRTWAVQNTTPATRVDIATGDDDTNLYRGFFGRRFDNGLALQVAAQNYGTGTRNRRLGGGGDAVNAFARVGWARGRFSVDAFASRLDRQRNPTFAFNTADTVLSRFEGRRDEGYLRLGWGDPDAGPWLQAIANAARFTLEGTGYIPRSRIDSVRAANGTLLRVDTLLAIDTTLAQNGTIASIDTTFAPDSGASRTEYVLTGGFTRWGVRLTAGDRWRVFNGRNWHAPSLRAAYERGLLSVSAYGERRAADSTNQYDVSARLQPLPWLAVVGAVSRTERALPEVDDLARNVARLEVAARLGRLWLTGGRILRDGGDLPVPLALRRPDSLETFAADPLPLVEAAEVGRAQGTLATARGRVWKDVFLDLHGLAWDAGGIYRPQYQLRGELRLQTNWLRRFPSGNFGLTFAVTDEYRSRTAFPVDSAGVVGSRFVPAWNTLGALLEIRIQNASVNFQTRNALGRDYEVVPGIRMPRALSFYGARWYFFN